MKNALVYSLLSFILLIAACQKKDPKEDCMEEFIMIRDLERYDGQTIEEQFYFEMFETEEEYLFLMGHHNIDFLASPFRCDGSIVCTDTLTLTTDCFKFLESAVNHGIVAITKD